MVKYYKKVATILPWTQPVFTSASNNGTVGGDKFACYAHIPQSALAGQAWYLFRANLGSEYSQGSAVNYPNGYWLLYNPELWNITNLSLYNIPYYGAPYNDGAMKTGNVYGSNDNQNWELLTSFTNTNYSAGGNYQVDLSSNTKYYRYYKIQGTSQGVVANPGIDHINGLGLIKVTATQKTETWQECTREEYDKLPEEDRKIIREVYILPTVNKYYKKATVVKEYIQPTANYGLTGKLAISGGNIQNLYGNILQNNPLNQSSVHNAFNGGSSTLAQYTGGNNPMFQWVCAIGEDVLPILSHITFTTNFNGYVRGSNDRANWVTIPNKNFSSGYHDIVLNTQYKYYCIQATSANGGNATSSGYYYHATLTNVRLYGTVTKQVLVNCTQTEYNQLPEGSRYKTNRNLEFSHKGDYIALFRVGV